MSPVETNPANVQQLHGLDVATQDELDAAILDLQGQIDEITIAAGGLTDNELLALAGTTAGVDKLPYFDSATTAATTPLTAQGRQLLDDTSFGAMLTTLGISPFAQTILDDLDAASARATIAAQVADPQLDTLAGLASVTNLTALASFSATTNAVPYFDTPTTMSTVVLNASTTLSPDSDGHIATQKATKAYIDAVVLGANPDASTTTKGLVKVSVAATTATEVIVAGDNDPRLTNATTSNRGIVKLSLAATTTTQPIVVGDNDPRLVATDASTLAKGVAKLSIAATTATNPIVVGDNDPRLGSASDASTTIKGVAKLSVAATTASNPVVVGDNDPRLTSIATTALTALGAVTPAADSLAYFTSTTQATTTSATAVGRALIGQSTTANARTALGLAIGTDVQAYDADLTTLGALGSGARSALGLAIGTNVQAYDLDLDALAGLTYAADVIPYFTAAHTATTTSFPAAGRSVLGLVPTANTMPYYTSSTAASTTALTAFARNLLSDGSPTLARARLLADDFGPVTLFGHSIMLSGSSESSSHGQGQRLAITLNTDADFWAIPFSILSGAIAGLAGWDYCYRRTEGVPAVDSTTAGASNPRREACYIFHGLNDFALPATGAGSKHQYSDLLPFRHALRACISRMVASNLAEEDDASVAFQTSGGGWATRGGTATAAGVLATGSGGRWQENTVVNKTVTITVPATFKGGTVTLGFLCDDAGHGANWSVAADGGAPTTVDARAANATLNGTPYWTPVVLRVTGLAAGAHTIVATPTALATTAYFDCWWMESDDPPLVAVAKQYTPTAGGYTTEFLTHVNQSIVDVVAEFSSNVFTIETDDLISGDAAGLLSDGVHPNDRGHALFASRVADAFRAFGRTRDSHAKGANYNPGVMRHPYTTPRNIIQPSSVGVVPLSVAAANHSATQTAHLLDLLDGDLGVPTYFDASGALVSTKTITQQSASTGTGLAILATTLATGHTAIRVNLGNSASALHTALRVEDADGFDTALSILGLSTDTVSQFRILGSGQVDWGSGGASPLDVTMKRTATSILTLVGSLNVSVGGMTVTGAATLSSTLSGTTAIFNNGVTVTGALTASSNVDMGGYVTIHAASTTSAGLTVNTPAVAAATGVKVNLGSSASLLHAAYRIEDSDAFDTLFINYLVSTDAQPNFRIVANGNHNWGSGGASAPDTTFARSATSVLTATAQFVATDGIRTKVVAASVTDGSFAVTPASGTIAIDTSHSKIWVRVGNTWMSSVTLT